MAVPDELMEILVCPDCHGDLEERDPPSEREQAMDSVLVCLSCGLHYPVRDGIPVMLIEEAFRFGAHGPGVSGGQGGPEEGEDAETSSGRRTPREEDSHSDPDHAS